MRRTVARITDWQQIEQHYRGGTLVLGNGASIADYPKFSYRSLFETANDNQLITEPVKKIFSHLNTADFELVLLMVWHTYHINEALGVTESETQRVYGDIRTALINSIREVHADLDDVREHLTHIYGFMQRFSKIFSLNYDLIVYWAMLKGNAGFRRQELVQRRVPS
ncbi:MAG: DUF4917 family protein [Dehalococcoidia bacterium]|nr:DUF4917 family protein [Dehalococcoidia bacterium]